MSPHGDRPASPALDQSAAPSDPEPDVRMDARAATPPPAWGGPAAQYTEALPEIPLSPAPPAKSSVKSPGKPATRSRRPRHRRTDSVTAEPGLSVEQPVPGTLPREAVATPANPHGPLPMLVALSGALPPPAERAVPARTPAARPRTDVDRLAGADGGKSRPDADQPAADRPLADQVAVPSTKGDAVAEVAATVVPPQPVSPAGQRMGPLPMVPPAAAPQLNGHPTRPMPAGLTIPPLPSPTRPKIDGIALLVGWMRGWPVRRLSVGGLVATLGAIMLLIGSFAPFVALGGSTAALHRLALAGAPDSYPAWSLRTFMFPLSVLPVVLAVVVVAMMVLGVRRSSGAVPLPFGSRQLMVASAFGALAILSGYAMSSKALIFEPAFSAPAVAGLTVGFGGGGLTMLLAALAMAAGATMHLMGVGPELAPAPDSVDQ